jgi:outer membrane protein OmpA-like peptidoglycan-associated protein
MKKLFSVLAVLGLVSARALAATSPQDSIPQYPYYVVVGAFGVPSNVPKFVQHVRDLKYTPEHDFHEERKLEYVYLLSTPDREQAIAEALRLRAETEFKDTWVYSGPLTRHKQPIAWIKPPAPEEHPIVASVADPQPDPQKLVEEKVDMSTELKNAKHVVFHSIRASDLTEIAAEVQVVEAKSEKKLGEYKTNTASVLKAPPGGSGEMSLVCESFGYRKVNKLIRYEELAEGEVINFEMVRLQKGDIAVMYNVYFYKDAAIMRPESRFEVDALLNMMNENPGIKVVIHGHTNGNASGALVTLGGSTNYFGLSDKNKRGFGSAKDLSEERAKLIRDFLVSKGVDPGRMTVKAWGGKRMLYDRDSPNAESNVRVEIEIL